MADVQALFEKFHLTIRTDYDSNATLREKKDIIVERVQNHLAKNKRPSCTEYIQGSYKMGVGVCTLPGGEFDIDVGLRFSFDDSKHTADEVRKWVFEAVDGHTEKVEEKVPCIRVTYKDGYHVDLVSYAWWDDQLKVEQHRLAHQKDGWRPADPPRLVDHVRDARKPFEGTEDSKTKTDQFRRVVRYLKRWNDLAIRDESNDKPSGLALVLLAEHHLQTPALTWDGELEDRAALERVAQGAVATPGRIVEIKPTPEGEDMFRRLSENAMKELKERFGRLAEALAFAGNTADVKEACKELKKILGDDFPCPDPEDEKKANALRTKAPAIVPSTASA